MAAVVVALPPRALLTPPYLVVLSVRRPTPLAELCPGTGSGGARSPPEACVSPYVRSCE